MEKTGRILENSNCSVRQKLIVYDAVVRTKLIYGMESAQINDAVKNKIDAFQIKGLRQILKMESTYAQKILGVERTNTNKQILKTANEIIKGETEKAKEIIKISDYYEIQRRKWLIAVINNRGLDPTGLIVIEDDSLQLIEYGIKRCGRPKYNWYLHALDKYWKYLCEIKYNQKTKGNFDIDNEEHTSTIIKAAEEEYFKHWKPETEEAKESEKEEEEEKKEEYKKEEEE